ncbi:MAG TPA: hypothetical protein VH834_14990 [Solirubrobacteraceae bacterium]
MSGAAAAARAARRSSSEMSSPKIRDRVDVLACRLQRTGGGKLAVIQSTEKRMNLGQELVDQVCARSGSWSIF